MDTLRHKIHGQWEIWEIIKYKFEMYVGNRTWVASPDYLFVSLFIFYKGTGMKGGSNGHEWPLGFVIFLI